MCIAYNWGGGSDLVQFFGVEALANLERLRVGYARIGVGGVTILPALFHPWITFDFVRDWE